MMVSVQNVVNTFNGLAVTTNNFSFPLAANEAEKAADINVLEVRNFGSMGRIYLGGEERDIDVGWRAAVAAVDGLEGREAK